MINLLHGDCLEQMKALPDNSVDSIVTDPPYGLSFMGKKWDIDVPATEVWAEAIRVLKPGGHLISFGGTRTYHRMAVAIEDAGFEIRDMVSWVYGSGFPKSLNIGKAVDKLQGNERAVVGERKVTDSDLGQNSGWNPLDTSRGNYLYSKGTSPWEGWGTALKPAQEPCVLARKPLSEKTVAANVLKWGTGGLNIDGCRVGTEQVEQGREGRQIADSTSYHNGLKPTERTTATGRFPANIIHDGSDEVLEVFPESKTTEKRVGIIAKNGKGGTNILGNFGDKPITTPSYPDGDNRSAARFFYCAKASKAERNRGCEGLEEKGTDFNKIGFDETKRNRQPRNNVMKNHHPTVKPIALMEYMIKLITPPGGTVLDPFMGSGSTGIAAKNLGHDFIGIEMDVDYLAIAKARIGVQ